MDVVNQNVRVNFKGKECLPPWALSNFIEVTAENHLKISTIQGICQLKQKGIDDSNLIVAEQSVHRFRKYGNIEHDNFTEFVELESKRESPERFWHIIEKHKRPIVFYKEQDIWEPLYLFNKPHAFKLRKLVVESPPQFTFEGLGSTFVDIFFAKRRDRREQELHEIKVRTKTAIAEQEEAKADSEKAIAKQEEAKAFSEKVKTIGNIVSTKQIIDSGETPEDIKEQANNALNNLLDYQAFKNEQIGINEVYFEQIPIREKRIIARKLKL